MLITLILSYRSFFCVYDSHGGGNVSQLCSENMLKYIMDTDEFQQPSLENMPPEKQRDLIKHGLIRGFLNVMSNN